MVNKKIKLLIVDDSQMFRESLKANLESAKITVVGTACDAFEAKEKVSSLDPDVLVIDIQMPKMDGITFLADLMEQYPLPCIMVTSSNVAEQEVLQAGAAGFLRKPRSQQEMNTFCSVLATKIIIASANKGRYTTKRINGIESKDNGLTIPGMPNIPKIKYTPEMPSKEAAAGAAAKGRDGYVVALGASTGGTDALECVIKAFPADMPPVVVVQHMPPVFTKMYAERLDRSCAVNVREAVDGDRLKNGDCIIGAGGYHLELKKDAAGYYISSRQGEKVSGHCPSVDVLFSSVAAAAGKKSIAALLTGMGADGAKGLLKMKKSGAYTIGQTKETCIVYGMPMEAYKLGACAEQQDLDKVGETICRRLAIGWTDKDLGK